MAGKRGVYVQEINGIRKTFDFPAHVLKDSREKLDPWLKNFKMWPAVCEQIRGAQVEIKNVTAAALEAATERKPLTWEFPDAPMRAVVKIWRIA